MAVNDWSGRKDREAKSQVHWKELFQVLLRHAKGKVRVNFLIFTAEGNPIPSRLAN